MLGKGCVSTLRTSVPIRYPPKKWAPFSAVGYVPDRGEGLNNVHNSPRTPPTDGFAYHLSADSILVLSSSKKYARVCTHYQLGNTCQTIDKRWGRRNSTCRGGWSWILISVCHRLQCTPMQPRSIRWVSKNNVWYAVIMKIVTNLVCGLGGGGGASHHLYVHDYYLTWWPFLILSLSMCSRISLPCQTMGVVNKPQACWTQMHNL